MSGIYNLDFGSRPKEVVLDPFLGSGTTAIAAKILNREYIGFEINPEYFEIAKERIEAIDKQTKLQEGSKDGMH